MLTDLSNDEQLVKELENYHNYLKQHRNDIEPLWDLVGSIFRPERKQMQRSADRGSRFNAHLHDSYAAQALHTWGRGIVGNMIYPKPQWLQVTLADRALMEDDQVIDYQQEWSEQVFHGFNRTNFYDVMPEMALDAGSTVGHLIPVIDTKKQRLHFQHEHPGDVWYALDVFGSVERIHRECRISAQAAKDRFGEDVLSETAKSYLRTNPFKEIVFVHCIFPNPNYDQNRQQPYAALYLPYASVYYEKTDRKIVEKSGLPWLSLTWRVHKDSRQWYSYTPAQCALTDGLTNNRMTQSLLMTTQKMSDPPLWIPQNLKIKTTPGGMTRYQDQSQVVKQLYDRLDWVIPDQERQRIHDSIDRWMSIPFFAMLTRMAEKSQPPTAYQISQTQAERATLLGPQVSSLRSDVLDPAIDVVWQWEEAVSTVPEMPQILLDTLIERQERQGIGRIETVTEYTGILSQIQSQATKSRSLMESLSMAATMIELYPESKYVLKEYNLMRDILQSGNMDQDNIKPQEEYEETIRAIMEQQAAQEQAERQKNVAEAYQRASQGDKLQREAA